jgi:glutathione peroxidase
MKVCAALVHPRTLTRQPCADSTSNNKSDRRKAFRGLAFPVSLPLLAVNNQPIAERKFMSAAPSPVLHFEVKDIAGNPVTLSKYSGKVVLIVNVASKCGNTPQYTKLQALHEKYSGDGLAILGFPCNQFKEQEPGSEAEIRQFCESRYGVKFDLFSKVDVNGPDASPLFRYLTSGDVPISDKGPVEWNFEKFLIARDGKLVARFRDEVEPDSVEVTNALKGALTSR